MTSKTNRKTLQATPPAIPQIPTSENQEEKELPTEEIFKIFSNKREQEVWVAASRVIVGCPLPEDSQLAALVLKEIENRAIILEKNEHFQESLLLRDVLKRAKVESIESQRRNKVCKLDKEITEEVNKVETNHERIQNEITDMERNLNEKIAQRQEMIYERHRKEKEQLDAEWKSNAKMRHYSHPSTQLKDLRQQENTYKDQGMTMEHKKIKEEADIIEQRDTLAATRRWESDYLNALGTLRKKHVEELESFDEFVYSRRQQIEKKAALQNELYNRKKKALEVKQQSVNNRMSVWEFSKKKEVMASSYSGKPQTARTPRLLKLPPLKDILSVN